MKYVLIFLFALIPTAVLAQPGDELWQQLVGAKEAQCSQAIIDSAREINRLKAEVQDLQKKLDDSKKAPPK